MLQTFCKAKFITYIFVQRISDPDVAARMTPNGPFALSGMKLTVARTLGASTDRFDAHQPGRVLDMRCSSHQLSGHSVTNSELQGAPEGGVIWESDVGFALTLLEARQYIFPNSIARCSACAPWG